MMNTTMRMIIEPANQPKVAGSFCGWNHDRYGGSA